MSGSSSESHDFSFHEYLLQFPLPDNCQPDLHRNSSTSFSSPRLHPYDNAGGHSATGTSTTESAGVSTSQAAMQATGDGDNSASCPTAAAIFPTIPSEPTLHGLVVSPPLDVSPLHKVYAPGTSPLVDIREAAILPLVEHPFMAQVISGVKNYDFRRYRMSHMVSHVYFYLLAPSSAVRYAASVKAAHSRIERGPIPETGVGNKEFNEGTGQWKGYKFAYKITGVWKLDNEITLEELKEKYGVARAPRGMLYVPENMKEDHGLGQMRKLW